MNTPPGLSCFPQVSHKDVELNRTPTKIQMGMNAMSPKSIPVTALEKKNGTSSDAFPDGEVMHLQAQLQNEKTRIDTAAHDLDNLRSAFRELQKGLLNLEPPRLRDAVHLVVKNGWKNVIWNHNYTVLHVAGELGRADIIPLLVKLHGDPSSKDYKGRTPIDIAKAKRHTHCVELLTKLQSVNDALVKR